MTPQAIAGELIREAPVLRHDDAVGVAVEQVLKSGLPALPVIDSAERLVGIFGEREFVAAVWPGYLKELPYAGFVRRTLDDAIEKRAGCRFEPVSLYMTTDRVQVGTDFSDVQVAEIFLHHRVLVIPVVDSGKVVGVITRADFFRSLAERVLERE